MQPRSRSLRMLAGVLTTLICVAPALADNISPSTHQYAVFADGKVTMNGRAIVSGHIGAGGDLSLQDDSQINEGVYSGGDMSLRYRVRIDGLVHSEQAMTIYDDSILRDSVQSIGNMTLRYRVQVAGDASSSGSISSMSGVSIGGNTSQYGDLPHSWAAPTVTVPTFNPGNPNVRVNHGNSRKLKPGKYGNLTLLAGSSVSLSSGTYHFDELSSQSDVKFLIDDSGGPVQIYVRKNMIAGYRSNIVLDSGDGSNLQWFVGGNLTMQADTQFVGQVQCFSDVTLQDRITTSGSIYAAGSFSCGWDCVLSVSEGNVFYVATSGSDANSGTSMSAPLRTIQAAVNKCVREGSVVYIAPGTYSESLQIGTGAGSSAVSGSSEYPIRLIADVSGADTRSDPGEVVLDGGNQRAMAIEIKGVDYWSIEGFSIRRYKEYGVRATNSGFALLGSRIGVPSRFAIYAVVDSDVTVRGCRFEREAGSGHVAWIQTTNGVKGIPIEFVGNDASLRGDRYLSTSLRRGQLNSGSGNNSDTRDITYGIIVQGNRQSLGEVQISNNQFSDMYLPVYVYTTGGRDSIKIMNNTVVGSLYSVYASVRRGRSKLIINNNIIDQCYYGLVTYTQGKSSLSVTGLLEHQITYNMSAFGRPYELDIITDDPRFYAPDEGDFSLWSTSPAVDAGTMRDAPSTDIGGRSRPSDGNGDGVAQVDLGAYEQVHEGGQDRVRVVRWREIGGDNNR